MARFPRTKYEEMDIVSAAEHRLAIMALLENSNWVNDYDLDGFYDDNYHYYLDGFYNADYCYRQAQLSIAEYLDSNVVPPNPTLIIDRRDDATMENLLLSTLYAYNIRAEDRLKIEEQEFKKEEEAFYKAVHPNDELDEDEEDNNESTPLDREDALYDEDEDEDEDDDDDEDED